MIEVRVTDVKAVADAIRLYELVPTAGELPAFKAGAHVDLHLGNGLTRSYSLVNSETEQDRYQIAVALDKASRGGSRFIHETVVPGQLLEIGAPRNNFGLVETAPHSVLIAGGVGITPMMSMISRLETLGRSWELHYCGRTRASAAFQDRLAPHGDKVALRMDDEMGGKFLDIQSLMRDAPAEAQFYCCGPAGMLEAFQKASSAIDAARVHFEFFAPREAAATDHEYTVVLARSEQTFVIKEGCTILDTLLDAGLDILHNCTQGHCGTCETRVLEGIPDHRDEVLTESERAAGKTMMICCSGSRSSRLVLDL